MLDVERVETCSSDGDTHGMCPRARRGEADGDAQIGCRGSLPGSAVSAVYGDVCRRWVVEGGGLRDRSREGSRWLILEFSLSLLAWQLSMGSSWNDPGVASRRGVVVVNRCMYQRAFVTGPKQVCTIIDGGLTYRATTNYEPRNSKDGGFTGRKRPLRSFLLDHQHGAADRWPLEVMERRVRAASTVTPHHISTMECVFPQEIIDDVIDHFQDYPKNLQTCSLVARSWVPRSRRSLFRDVSFPGKNKFEQWCKAIPPGPDGIASYTRILRLSDPWGKLMDPTLLQSNIAHFTSFRSLQSLALFLVDLSSFDRISITSCFRHFETVQSLVLCNVASPITNILLLTYLFPNLQRLDIEDLKPPKDMMVMDVPVEAEPFMVRTLETAPTLRGSFRMANITVGASQLLSWFLKFPLDFREIRVTDCDWTSTDPLSRLIDACGPKLRLLEVYVPLGWSFPLNTPTCILPDNFLSRRQD